MGIRTSRPFLTFPIFAAACFWLRQVLVFVLYKKEAERVEQLLQGRGYNAAAIHGNLNQVRTIEPNIAFLVVGQLFPNDCPGTIYSSVLASLA